MLPHHCAQQELLGCILLEKFSLTVSNETENEFSLSFELYSQSAIAFRASSKAELERWREALSTCCHEYCRAVHVSPLSTLPATLATPRSDTAGGSSALCIAECSKTVVVGSGWCFWGCSCGETIVVGGLRVHVERVCACARLCVHSCGCAVLSVRLCSVCVSRVVFSCVCVCVCARACVHSSARTSRHAR